MGPGRYRADKSFGEGVKNHTLSKKKRFDDIRQSAGPGSYRVEKAENMTKTRSTSAMFSGAKRPNNFKPTNGEAGLGPGTYRGATT